MHRKRVTSFEDKAMLFNNYEGCVEQWKMDLVAKRAGLFGFQYDDILDIQQDLALEILAFKFDPEHSNKARESTALISLIDNQLLKRIRHQRRTENKMADLSCFAESLQEPMNAYLILDIRKALIYLPKLQRQICLALSKGCTTAEIAHLLKISQRTVQRHIHKIAHYFRTIGLDRWLLG